MNFRKHCPIGTLIYAEIDGLDTMLLLHFGVIAVDMIIMAAGPGVY